MSYDVIVCGAGIIGLWTANHLAEQFKSVLLLEQFSLTHKHGSSSGKSRVFRSAYTTQQHGDMMPESTIMWKKLEKKYGKQLLVCCGYLDSANDEICQQNIKVLENIGVPYTKLKASEISEKFPGYYSNNFNGVFDTSGGVLKADECLAAVKDSFIGLGGKLLENEELIKIQPINGKLVKILTNKARYECTSLVLTCGSWINKILSPLGVVLPLVPCEVDVVYWKAKNPELYGVDKFPTTYIVMSDDVKVYSIPIIEFPGMMKVCLHRGVEVDHDFREETNEDIQRQKAEDIKTLTRVVSLCYPNLIPTPAHTETCIYSMTPDKDFIIDHLPKHKNIVIGSGFSGHGFKLSPVAGKILAELALDKEPSYDLKHFSISRFPAKSVL